MFRNVKAHLKSLDEHSKCQLPRWPKVITVSISHERYLFRQVIYSYWEILLRAGLLVLAGGYGSAASLCGCRHSPAASALTSFGPLPRRAAQNPLNPISSQSARNRHLIKLWLIESIHLELWRVSSTQSRFYATEYHCSIQ